MRAAGDRLQDTARQAALALPDVSHGRPFTPGLDVYKVAGKAFLIVTDDPDEQIITVTCESATHDSGTMGRVTGAASIGSAGIRSMNRCLPAVARRALRCRSGGWVALFTTSVST